MTPRRWTYRQLSEEIASHYPAIRQSDVVREFGKYDRTAFSRVMAADPDGLASEDWTQRVLSAITVALAVARTAATAAAAK